MSAAVIRAELTTDDLQRALDDAVAGYDRGTRHDFHCFLVGALVSEMGHAGMHAEVLSAIDTASRLIEEAQRREVTR